jgi:EAL domain-containing protein (putative c-di-GMP-specific phosphodiesterase class I)
MMLDAQMTYNSKLLFLPPQQQEAGGKRVLNELIETQQIRPHFQPVIDLITTSVLGFEILSRGAPPLAMPQQMFAEAKRLGMTWELETACRSAALRKISSLPETIQSALFFINVSPDIFSDPRFVERFTQTMLREFGIDQKQIVIEITEEKSVADYMHFEKLVAHYANQGFKIALDDFGSGYSGLITLIASTPHYLKLDMALVRDIHKHDYKQKLVKAIIAFASSVNARLIAEGVSLR